MHAAHPADANVAWARARRRRVQIAHVRVVLEANERLHATAAGLVQQRDGRVFVYGDRERDVLERSRRGPHTIRRRRAARTAADRTRDHAVGRCVSDPRGDASDRDQIVVRIVAGRFGARVSHFPIEHLDGAETRDRRRSSRFRERRDPGRGRSRADRHVGDELFDLQNRYAGPPARHRIANEHDRLPRIAQRARLHLIVAHEIEDCIVADAGRLIRGGSNPQLHRRRDFVDGATTERVVRVRLENVCHASSSSARRDRPRRDASAFHGSASRSSARSASALRRFSCARVARCPESVQG